MKAFTILALALLAFYFGRVVATQQPPPAPDYEEFGVYFNQ